MCPLCEGTGGVTLQTLWKVEFLPCNHPKCDFDEEAAWKETQAMIDKINHEIKVRS